MKNILILLLFPAFLAAQNNIQQVENYLGPYRFANIAPPKGTVRFVFNRQELVRESDGRATYKTLLQKGYFADPANYGTLSAVVITENGKPVTVARYTPATDETGGLSRVDASTGSALPIADSASIADQMKGVRHGLERGMKTAKPAVEAIWETWYWFFKEYALPVLIIASILLWFISALCASESLITLRGFDVAGRAFVAVHSWSSFFLALTLAVIALTMLVSICLWALKSGSLILMTITGAGSAFIAYKIVTRLIPNLPVSGTRSAARYTGGDNNQGLIGR